MGFRLQFTTPMAAAAGEAAGYQVRRFRYDYHPQDGSLRRDEVEVPIAAARLAADGRALELELVELQPGYVYELVAGRAVVSRAGQSVVNSTAYYTLNRLHSGATQPGPTRLVAKAAEPLGPGDAGRGAEIYRLYCLACHQADGRGSAQAGTPDYTLPGGPLTRSDDELIATITNGKLPTPPAVLPMPPWGNVLPPQAIRDVLAHLRQTFQPPRAK
jgi:mono/diheme cytochrome c family protein